MFEAANVMSHAASAQLKVLVALNIDELSGEGLDAWQFASFSFSTHYCNRAPPIGWNVPSNTL